MKTSMKKNSGLIKSQTVYLLAVLFMMLMAVPIASASCKSGLLTDSLLSSVYKEVKVDVETDEALLAGKKKKPGTSGRKPLWGSDKETYDQMMAWGPGVIIRTMPRVVRRPMPNVVRRPMPRVVRRPVSRVIRTPMPMVIRTPIPF